MRVVEAWSDFVVYGGGGIGKEVLQTFYRLRGCNVIGVIDDKIPAGETIYENFKCLGNIDFIKDRFEKTGNKTSVIVALADPDAKESVRNKLSEIEEMIYTPALIDPSIFQFDVNIGKGCIISPGSIFTTGIEIGDFVFVNLSCTLGHDVKIGDFSTISPGVNISGNAVIEEKCYVGSGAIILPGIRLGRRSLVGAGAVVTKDVDSEIVVVGNPAKYLKKNVSEKVWR
jgi:sugar O-acyltransferase (sialic acid O-acetyltransferase NeuD family)